MNNHSLFTAVIKYSWGFTLFGVLNSFLSFIRDQIDGLPVLSIYIIIKGILDESGDSSISSFIKTSDRSSENEVLPTGNGRSHNGTQVPLRLFMGNFRIKPFILFHIIYHKVRELWNKTPPSINGEFILLSEDWGDVSSTGFRWVSFREQILPFKSFNI